MPFHSEKTAKMSLFLHASLWYFSVSLRSITMQLFHCDSWFHTQFLIFFDDSIGK